MTEIPVGYGFQVGHQPATNPKDADKFMFLDEEAWYVQLPHKL